MKTALIIPAYKPDKKLLALLAEFQGDENYQPVVVDDGSGSEYAEIFDALPEGVVLLRHEVNRGKGAALKTAMKHVLEALPECDLAITADADGQHTHEDILRVTAEARQHPDELVLGSRKFDGNVPFRSKFGNGLTRHVFAIVSGAKVRDTQTGLRAFGRETMEKFSTIPGDRYEYEINMLLWAARNGVNIHELTIKTVYIDDNASSHFHPIRDGFKIYACILKFTASSLISFIVDYVLVLVLNAVFNSIASIDRETALKLSVVIARLVSATVNFIINKKVVFEGNESTALSAAKYAALAAVILVANYLLIELLNIRLSVPLWIAKLVVEIVLFSVSFVVQGKFVFTKHKKQ